MWYQRITPNRAKKVFLRDFLVVEHVFFHHVLIIANYFANCSPTKIYIALILSSSRRRKDRSDGRARDFLPSFEFPPLCHSLEASKIGVGSRLIAGSGSLTDISVTVCVAQSAWDIPYLNRKIFLCHYQTFKSDFFGFFF